MIKSFKDKNSQSIWERWAPKGFSLGVAKVALRKLRMLNNAECLDDLRIPPGNRLEKLVGDRKNQYSIRINNRFRICFIWNDGAEQVEIIDYH